MICSVLIHSLGISLLCFSLKSDYRTSVKMQGGGGGGRDILVIDLKSLVKAIFLFSWITTPPPPTTTTTTALLRHTDSLTAERQKSCNHHPVSSKFVIFYCELCSTLKSILILTEKIKVLFHLIIMVTLRNLTKNSKDNLLTLHKNSDSTAQQHHFKSQLLSYPLWFILKACF